MSKKKRDRRIKLVYANFYFGIDDKWYKVYQFTRISLDRSDPDWKLGRRFDVSIHEIGSVTDHKFYYYAITDRILSIDDVIRIIFPFNKTDLDHG